MRAYTDADIPEALLRGTLMDNKDAIIATRDPVILPVAFDSVFVRQVTDFMHALTDKAAIDLARFIPQKVPSRLPVDR
ncbi:MAG TPA: hypothetical protein VK864_01680 [Longimicrobiales bacterium]|nr:hypothetical protein [Longimicrobiales bacterium]